MPVRIPLLAFAVVAFLGVGAGETLASHVTCGQTITTDTNLDSDLLNCPGDGIVIGAPNIELDLNGHTIDGTGVGEGIDNSAGHDGVGIEHGTITQFGIGVLLTNASRNELEQLNVSQSTGDAGIQLLSSSANRLARNTASGNGVHGIHLQGSNNNRLIGNTANLNGDDGIDLFNSDNNRLEGNTANQNGDDGILLVSANLPGTSSSNNTLVQNTANNNGTVQPGTGFLLHVGVGNLLRRNTANGNSAQGMFLLSSDNNTLRLNTTSSNGTDGVIIFADSDGTLLDRNTANLNRDDGLDTENAATTFVGNIANNNTDLGIEAVPGVTDGGGNKALGNGNPAQCTNVACT